MSMSDRSSNINHSSTQTTQVGVGYSNKVRSVGSIADRIAALQLAQGNRNSNSAQSSTGDGYRSKVGVGAAPKDSTGSGISTKIANLQSISKSIALQGMVGSTRPLSFRPQRDSEVSVSSSSSGASDISCLSNVIQQDKALPRVDTAVNMPIVSTSNAIRLLWVWESKEERKPKCLPSLKTIRFSTEC